MKFFTLFAAALLFCSVSHVSAQTSQTQGELKFDNVIMKGYSQIATPMACTYQQGRKGFSCLCLCFYS